MSTMDKAHGLVIGISKYEHINSLPLNIINDAKDVHAVLVDPRQGGYPPDNVKLLVDGGETPARAAILGEMERLAEHCDKDSTVFIYFSGHGGRVESGAFRGEYLLPADTVYPTDQSLAATAISGDQFTEALRAIQARKVVVVFDCCHSAGIGQPKDLTTPKVKSGLAESYYTALNSGEGRAIIASSQSDEFSYANEGERNSVFTRHLLDGLKGNADSKEGLIHIFDIFEYVQPHVTTEQKAQHPIFKAELKSNFPVCLHLGGAIKSPAPEPEESASEVNINQEFPYDAYISFVDEGPDAEYVRKTLIPRLREGGVSVAISEDVDEFGVARVVNADRGMEKSKRVLVILSNAYVYSEWMAVENAMEQDRGLEMGDWRLLPVFIERVDRTLIPQRIKFLTAVNLTDPAKADALLASLIKALKGPVPKILARR
jgi:Caspase domain/TIR domain